MKDVLARYMGKKIGINLDRPFHIVEATITAIEDNHFTVKADENRHLHHFSYQSIVQIIEDPEGVEIKHIFTADQSYPLIIKVGHLLEYTPA